MALGKGLGSLIPAAQPAPAPVQPKTTASTPVKTAEPAPAEPGTRIFDIPLSKIVPNTEQPRKHFSHRELEDLVTSIHAHGVLQPINVTEKPDGGYELISGERRFRASQIAGKPTIPAIVRVTESQQERLELALIENIQRQNLNPIEEAFAYERLSDEFDMTQEQIARQVGKSRSTIANTIRLLALPEPIKQGLIEEKISTGKARALLSLKDEAEQLRMYRSMIGEAISVRDVEAEVAKRAPSSRKGSVRRDPNIKAQEDQLEGVLGTKVRITNTGSSGKITIDYHSFDELRRIIDIIES
jgi:ParB family chromosome partitioning protein